MTQAHCVSVLWTFRDWDLKADGAADSQRSPAARNAYLILQELLLNIRAYLQADQDREYEEVTQPTRV